MDRVLFSGLFLALILSLILARPALAGDGAPGRKDGERPSSPEVQARPRVYSRLLDPRENPHDDRRAVRPPGWDVFGGRTRFTSLRGFSVEEDRVVRFAEDIEKYTRTHGLGEVIWPSYPVIFARNLGELADEILRRDLYLFDIWGFVPGSGPGGYWQQFKPPAEAFQLLESKLGPRWLGMDVGEQDGRYVGGYAPQMYPASGSRLEQYLNFQRHFQRMGDDLGNRLSTLVSLNFGHYLIKEGTYATMGAETGQALPNSQVYYSFIRGAGKQYGVPWFGNVSVFNRWGYKTYGSEGPDHGPTLGTSLNLMKRLLYSHILYNCVFVGFESGWFDGDRLSPIGRIQKAAQKWVVENGQPGVHVAPIALLVDFLSGWSFPRGLYTVDVFRVWANLPYGPGDHLTDGVLECLYPGYADSSYFHDESGFSSPTPYGDAADCLLGDAPGWLLDRYGVVVAAGELGGGAEMKDKLEAYAGGGGRLIITAGSLARLPGGLCGVRAAGPGPRIQKGGVVRMGTNEVVEDFPFDLCRLEVPPDARTLALAGEVPAAVEVVRGRGSVTVLASPFGIPAEPALSGPVPSEVDRPLSRPYPLLRHVRAILDRAFRSTALFDVGEGLSFIACRKGPGDYVLGVCNNSLAERALSIRALHGTIASLREIPVDGSERGEVGHLPKGFEKAELGRSGEGRIAGGDVRIFSVRVESEEVEETPHLRPPPRPRGRSLPLRSPRTIQEEILARPTFFDRFDGVAVDWKYLRDREREALRREGAWLRRQGLRVTVDLTSGINLYPDLRLLENIREDFAASMAAIDDLLSKMPLLGARDLIMSLHRHPENNFSDAESRAGFEAALRRIAGSAGQRGIDVHLRLSPSRPPWSIDEAADLLRKVGAPNLKLAPSTALLLERGPDAGSLAGKLGGTVGLWLVSAPGPRDVGGAAWNFHAPISGSGKEEAVRALLGTAPDAPLVLDAIYGGWDEEYLDSRALDRKAP